MKKIMIVEDEKSIRDEVRSLIENAGYEACVLEDFRDSKNEILKACPDLILMDINIPYCNGEELLKEIRKESDVPVIMLTSKNTEIDEVLSISYGADDFITKPYNPTVLLLRIGNIFKRMDAHAGNTEILSYGGLQIDVRKGTITGETGETVLSKNEMLILSYLVSNHGRIVTRDELMTDLWNNDEYLNDNALTVNISRLRNKLGMEEAIETRKGQGYILK